MQLTKGMNMFTSTGLSSTSSVIVSDDPTAGVSICFTYLGLLKKLLPKLSCKPVCQYESKIQQPTKGKADKNRT